MSISLKIKLQSTPNSCIRYCLGLKDWSPIRKNEFEKTNKLPVSNGADQCLAVLQNALSPKYMDNMYSLPISENIRTPRSTDSFIVLFLYKRNLKLRKLISYLDSKIWNDLNQDIKASPSANGFKDALRRRFFKS